MCQSSSIMIRIKANMFVFPHGGNHVMDVLFFTGILSNIAMNIWNRASVPFSTKRALELSSFNGKTRYGVVNIQEMRNRVSLYRFTWSVRRITKRGPDKSEPNPRPPANIIGRYSPIIVNTIVCLPQGFVLR